MSIQGPQLRYWKCPILVELHFRLPEYVITLIPLGTKENEILAFTMERKRRCSNRLSLKLNSVT